MLYKNFAYAWKEELDATITWTNLGRMVHLQYTHSAERLHPGFTHGSMTDLGGKSWGKRQATMSYIRTHFCRNGKW
jgi:hypothetical protein